MSGLSIDPRVFLHGVGIELDAEPRTRGYVKHSVGVEGESRRDQLFDVGNAGLILHPTCDGQGRRERQISRDADAGVPTVRHQQHPVVVGHPTEPSALAQPAALCQVGLDDV